MLVFSADELLDRLLKAYKQLESRIGDPLEQQTLIGPLHNRAAVLTYKAAVAEAIAMVSSELNRKNCHSTTS